MIMQMQAFNGNFTVLGSQFSYNGDISAVPTLAVRIYRWGYRESGSMTLDFQPPLNEALSQKVDCQVSFEINVPPGVNFWIEYYFEISGGDPVTTQPTADETMYFPIPSPQFCGVTHPVPISHHGKPFTFPVVQLAADGSVISATALMLLMTGQASLESLEAHPPRFPPGGGGGLGG